MKRDGRRVQVVKEGWPVSVGKRVAPASSLFHPPATLLPACCSVQRGGRRGQRGRKKGTRAGRGWRGEAGKGLSHAYPLDSSFQSVHVYYPLEFCALSFRDSLPGQKDSFLFFTSVRYTFVR